MLEIRGHRKVCSLFSRFSVEIGAKMAQQLFLVYHNWETKLYKIKGFDKVLVSLIEIRCFRTSSVLIAVTAEIRLYSNAAGIQWK